MQFILVGMCGRSVCCKKRRERDLGGLGPHGRRGIDTATQACRSFIQIKGVGEGREKEIQTERGRRDEDQPASSEVQWERERVRVGGACLIKGPFASVYIEVTRDVAAIGPRAAQGTAWVHPAS